MNKAHFFVRIQVFLLALLILSGLHVTVAAGEETPSGAADVPADESIVNNEAADDVVYNISLFSDDQPLLNPINDVFSYFTLPPGVKLLSPSYIEVIYSHSSTIINELSVLTVVVNGLPLESRHVVQNEEGRSVRLIWKIELPPEQIKEGINEIGIKSRHRSVEGLCSDLDNDANWILIHDDTNLHLKTRRTKTYLRDYPYPFLDDLSPSLLDACWHLPPDPQPEEIEVMLQLVSDLGRGEPYRQMNSFDVFSSGKTPQGKKEIIIGTVDRWADQSDLQLPAGVGALQFVPKGENSAAARLLVTGSDQEGLSKAQSYLTTEKLLAQIEENRLLIKQWPPEEPLPQPLGRPGSYTFEELGYPYISLDGAFRQVTSVVLKRPLNWGIGRGSYTEIRFRHSAVLNPERSVLTIYINGRPVNSVALNQSNAEGGVLRAEFPVEELQKSEWVVSLVFYHHLTNVDCSKRYGDIAWSVVEGDSFIYLAPGKTGGYPSLDNLPHLQEVNNAAEQPVTMWLSANPSDRQLSLAAMLAARAGQINRLPLRWHVVLGEDLEQADLPSTPVIMIGYSDEESRLALFKEKLILSPDLPQGYKAMEEMPLLPDRVADAAILQALRSPWNKNTVLYSILGNDDGHLDALGKVLTDTKLSSQISGQLCLISPAGFVSSFTSQEGEKGLKPGIVDSVIQFVQKGGAWKIYALVMMIVLLGIGLSLWIAGKRS